MKISELLFSTLDITEYEYIYKGQFTLKAPEKAKIVDIDDIENDKKLNELIKFFGIEDLPKTVKKYLSDNVMKNICIGSPMIQGECYNL